MQSNDTNADRYTQQSFTWRRMKPWQIWALAISAVVIVVAALLLT